MGDVRGDRRKGTGYSDLRKRNSTVLYINHTVLQSIFFDRMKNRRKGTGYSDLRKRNSTVTVYESYCFTKLFIFYRMKKEDRVTIPRERQSIRAHFCLQQRVSAGVKTSGVHVRMRNEQRERGRLGRHRATCGTVCGRALHLC
jgi:hypothetical protein